MSLEEALNANTAAIEKLTALLANPLMAVTPEGTKVVKGLVVEDTPVTSDGAKPSGKKSTGSAPKSDQPKVDTREVAAKAEEKPTVPPYEAVKAAVLNVKAVKGMEAAKALLAQFGVKTLPEVKPEKLADVLTAAEKELA